MADRSALPRKRPVQKRAEVTIDAILIAVEQVLDKHGLGGLTTNRVAEVAGVSVGSLYQYYPNKEALVRAVQERYLNQTLDGCRAMLAATEGVPVEQVCERIAAALLALRERQLPIHRWLVELRTAAEFQEPYRVALEAFVDEVAGFLGRRPDVRVGDPRAAAWVIVHALDGIVHAVSVRGRAMDAAPVAAEALAMIRAYLIASR